MAGTFNVSVPTSGWTDGGDGTFSRVIAVPGLPIDAEGIIGYATGDLAGAMAGVAAGLILIAQTANQITLRANIVPTQSVSMVLTVLNSGNGGQGIITMTPGLNLPSASLIDVIYPVGVIYESDDKTPPNIVFGRGAWQRINGVMLVGVNESDPDFNAAGKTGGEKAHMLTAGEMPIHNHTANVSGSHTHGAGTLAVNSTGAHTHDVTSSAGSGISGSGNVAGAWNSAGVTSPSGSAGGHSHSISGTTASSSPALSVSIVNNSGGQAHNNLPPYRTTYMWRRTA